jgi:hypothetical protein
MPLAREFHRPHRVATADLPRVEAYLNVMAASREAVSDSAVGSALA